jgi:hypothetical protein
VFRAHTRQDCGAIGRAFFGFHDLDRVPVRISLNLPPQRRASAAAAAPDPPKS